MVATDSGVEGQDPSGEKYNYLRYNVSEIDLKPRNGIRYAPYIRR
jgi:hypothetical protein